MGRQMNASPNEVQLILDSINDLRNDVRDIKTDVRDVKTDVAGMDKRINGRIRKLEQFRWQLVGGAAAVSLAAGIILRVATL